MTLPRQFLPNVAGADIPSEVYTVPINATIGNGPLAGQTTYFDLNLVNFDWVTWHDYEWENWVLVDALLNTAIGFLNIRGFWQPNTAYTAGASVYDPEDISTLYIALEDHTSSTDFQADIAAGRWMERTDASPAVTSVFGRVGDITPEEADYSTFFYTKAEVDTQQGAQDQVSAAITDDLNALAGLLNTDYYNKVDIDAQQLAQDDDRALKMTWGGPWVAGTYVYGDVATNIGNSWVVIAPSTIDEPTGASSDWALVGSLSGDSSDKVLKSGDTMTGSLIVDDPANPGYVSIVNDVSPRVNVSVDGITTLFDIIGAASGGPYGRIAYAPPGGPNRQWFFFPTGAFQADQIVANADGGNSKVVLSDNSSTPRMTLWDDANNQFFMDRAGGQNRLVYVPNGGAAVIWQFDANGVFHSPGGIVFDSDSPNFSMFANATNNFISFAPNYFIDYVKASGNINFVQNGSTRFTMVQGGNIISNAPFLANSSVVVQGETQFNNQALFNVNGGNPTFSHPCFFATNGGNVYAQGQHNPGNWISLNLVAGGAAFQHRNTGSAFAPGIWENGSDERVKDNVTIIADALDKVCTLRGVTFTRSDLNDRAQAGIIAQQLEAVLPEGVSKNEHAGFDDFRAVDPMSVIALLVQAVKELTERVEELEDLLV